MSTRLSLIALGTTLGLAAGPAAAAAPGSPAPDPWVSVTPEGFHRFAVPYEAVREIVGAEPVAVEVQGTFGPAGTWADLATELQGAEYVAQIGPLAPGLVTYTYTATLVDRTKISFREPTSPRAVTSDDTLATLFVPGEDVGWMSDAAEPGTVTELTYRFDGGERPALVWTPPGHEPARPHRTLVLLADEGQSAQEWAELGRAPQVLDHLHAAGELEDVVVVMARLTEPAELTDALVPALRETLTLADDGVPYAVAGIGTGAEHALRLAAQGGVEALGLLSPAPGTAAAAESLAGQELRLARVYVGNALDPAQEPTAELLDALPVAHDFDGVTPGSGGTWETWRSALRDFASRTWGDDVGGPRAGHLPLDPTPRPGEVTVPHVDPDGIVTFVTGPQWADATDVTVWGNWAPHGAWLRIPMTRDGDRWRLSLGPLDGFFYYRYVVDGVDHKDPADTVNTLTGVSPLFVPGERDHLLADVPEGQGGALEVLTYTSEVAPGERKAYVWTPPGYDPERLEPYPVLFLNHGGDQSWGDWVEVGRARQIFDNLSLEGAVVPMVVVMGDGNVSDFPAELLENLAPAVEAAYHVSSAGSHRAIAGLSMGAMNTLTTWLTRPGEFAYVGAFSGFLFQDPPFDAAEVNAATRLARIYTGDTSDFTHDNTMGLMAMLDARGVDYEFPGVTPGPHGFDVWQAHLIDFAPRLFQDLPEPQGTSADDDAARPDASEPGTSASATAPGWLWALVGGAAVGLAVAAARAVRRRRSPRGADGD